MGCRWCWYLLLGLIVWVVPRLSTAQVPSVPAERQSEYRDIAKDLRCPTCTGLSVLESDAPFSVQIKDLVVKKMAEGKAKDEILQYFVERYGVWILRQPPTSGVSLLAWLIPAAMLVGGPLAIWFFVWRRKKSIATHGVRSIDAIVAEFQARLQEARQVPK